MTALLSGKMNRLGSLQKVDYLIGSLICTLAAIVACRLASGYSWRTMVPLIFSAVLLAIAFAFGTRAGILGSLLSAVVFAALLFAPVGSIHVTNEAARSNLGWMLLIGVSFSLLFAPQTSWLRRR
jgi:K+-sensing histidine kinase KdpD